MAKCPYCKQPLVLSAKARDAANAKVVRKEVTGSIKKEVMYVCPHCDCVLGFAFFMGGLLTGRPS